MQKHEVDHKTQGKIARSSLHNLELLQDSALFDRALLLESISCLTDLKHHLTPLAPLGHALLSQLTYDATSLALRDYDSLCT
jgi:hypothetical protein